MGKTSVGLSPQYCRGPSLSVVITRSVRDDSNNRDKFMVMLTKAGIDISDLLMENGYAKN